MKPALALCLLLLVGCSAEDARKFTQVQLQTQVDELIYAKAPNGLCFASIKGDSRTLTNVPCEEAGL